MSVNDCKIIQFPRITDGRGDLSFIEGGAGRHISFEIKRIYYLYNLTVDRGKHAHKTLYQMLLAIHGSFDVTLDDGREKKVFHLSQPDGGLWIVPGLWRELTNFSPDAVCLVLASEYFDESDYIRDYDEFLRYTESLRQIKKGERQ